MRCNKQLKLFNCVQSPQTHKTKSDLNKDFTTLKPIKKILTRAVFTKQRIPRSYLAYNSTAEIQVSVSH